MKLTRMIPATAVAAILLASSATAPAQTFDAVIVQGQPEPAIYTFQASGPPGGQFALSAAVFPNPLALPATFLNAIQWLDPGAPPQVDQPLYLYQIQGPLGTVNLNQLMMGNLFGTVGFVDGFLDLQQPPGFATLQVPPLVLPGNQPGPGDQINRGQSIPAVPPQFQETLFYFDPILQNGLDNTILVGMAQPGLTIGHRGMFTYGPAVQPEPTDPNGPGGNGEFDWVLAPAIPDPCLDESLITEAMLAYLSQQETQNGIHIESETEVVNFVTVRDVIRSWVEADDGFTYVTVVEDFVTTKFYRFPTGTIDPKGIVPIPLLFGDANNDGVVTADDLVAVQQNFGNAGPAGDGRDLGDANDDGVVTADDLIAVQQFFGSSLAPSGHAVPEPATAALLSAGLLAISRRRRR